MRKLIVILAGAALMATAACNTIAGMGRDVEKAGDTVEDAAEKAK